MADVQGGLNAISQEPIEQPVEQPVAQPVAQPEVSVGEDALARLQKQRAAYDQQLQEMIDSYNKRTNRGYDPKWLGFAAGMGKPTQTGNFFEALSNAMTGYTSAADQEEKERREAAKARLEMMQTGISSKEQLLTKDLLSKLYKTDQFGQPTNEIDPKVAQQLATLTGDPKYQQMVVAEIQTRKTRESFNKIFPTKEIELPDGTKKTTINFDPSALSDVVKSSSDPAKTLGELTDTVKKMRQNGMLGDQSTRDTPFDTISLFAKADRAIQQQAKYYADKYKKGLITEEEADKYAKSLMELYEKSLSRADANVFKELNLNLKSDLMSFQIQGKKAEKSKEVTNALANLDLVTDQVAHIKDHVGRFNGLAVGTLTSRLPFMSTDAKDYVNAVETLKSQAFLNQVSQMRGMGALSNQEGQKIQQALANLNIEQSKKEFDRNLNMIISIMSQAKERQLRLAKGYGLTSEDLGGASIPAEATPKETETKGATPKSNVIRYDAQGRRING